MTFIFRFLSVSRLLVSPISLPRMCELFLSDWLEMGGNLLLAVHFDR
jgi:hypothetical protein